MTAPPTSLDRPDAGAPATALVLGGTGFIGSHLVHRLVQGGTAVRVLTRRGSDRSRVHGVMDHVAWMEGEFMDAGDLAKAVAGVDVVFHLVSSSVPATGDVDPVADVRTNVLGTVQLLEACVRAGVRKLVYVSSGGTVYGKLEHVPVREDHPLAPLYAYGIGKAACEQYIGLYHRMHGLDHAILRVANAYGERQHMDRPQGIIGVWLGRIMRGEPVDVWGDGSTARDYVHVEDVARALVLASVVPTPEHVYNIGSGNATSITDLGRLMGVVTGRTVHVRNLPARAHDVPLSMLDITRAVEALGWRPRIGIEEGLRRTWHWMLAQGPA